MKARLLLSLPIALSCLLLVACEGNLSSRHMAHQEVSPDIHEPDAAQTPTTPGDPALVPGPTTTPELPEPGEALCTPPNTSIASPMRRITRQEYDNTLRALFPTHRFSLTADAVLPDDDRLGPLTLNSLSDTTGWHVEAFRVLAEQIAAEIAAQHTTLLPCDGEADGACMEAHLSELLPRFHHRPIARDELAPLLALYEAGAAESDHAEGVRYVFEALLQSPSFLYTYDSDEVADDVELARRMATLLWRSVPDEALWLAAARGELSDPDQRVLHAQRMLSQQEGKLALRTFIMQWFGVDMLREDHLDADEPAALRVSMLNESQRLIDAVIDEHEADYRLLLTSSRSTIDARLLAHHGLREDQATLLADGLYEVSWAERRGLLTHPSVLSQYEDPIHRGKRIRNHFLCDDIMGADGIDINSIPTSPTESQRSKAEKRMTTSPCLGCHLMMDDIGLAFDTFDEMGRYRLEDEHGNPLMEKGNLTNTMDIDGTFEDSGALMERLADSNDVRACLARHLFVYSYGRYPDPQRDGCHLSHIAHSLETRSSSISRALIDIIASDAFTRTPRP